MKKAIFIVHAFIIAGMACPIIAICSMFSSCGPCKAELDEKERQAQACPYKYQMGDVVEVKPDHQKVVVISLEEVYCPAVVYWVRRGDGVQEKLQQELIYGIAKDE